VSARATTSDEDGTRTTRDEDDRLEHATTGYLTAFVFHHVVVSGEFQESLLIGDKQSLFATTCT